MPLHRTSRDTSGLRSALCAALALLCGLVGGIRHASTAEAQMGSAAITYQGTLTLGGVPAEGMEVIVVTARTAHDTTLCGRARTGGGGSFTLAIPRDPRCVAATRTVPAPDWYFLVNGEQVDHASRAIYLDQPATLGQTRRTVLGGNSVPGRSAPAGDGATGGAIGGSGPSLNAIRYFGALTAGEDRRPAPRGTVVTVRGRGGAICAGNSVLDDQGHYYVDIPATADCARATVRDPVVDWEFVANGEAVQRTNRGLAIDAPNTLAGAQALNLHARQAVASDTCPVVPTTARHHRSPVTDARADWSGAWLDRAVERAIQPPVRPVIPPRVQLVVDNRFCHLHVTLQGCFARYRLAVQEAPIRDLLAYLDGETGEDRTTVTIVTSIVRPVAAAVGADDLAETTASDSDLAIGGVPVNATVAIYDPLVLPDTPPESQSLAINFCGTLIHELTHAADFMSGVRGGINERCVLPGGELGAFEIKAMAVENTYRRQQGLEPFHAYNGVPLPPEAIAPTAESCEQYAQGMICPPP